MEIYEKDLYRPTREFLLSKFQNSFPGGNCHLAITANGKFKEALKKAVRQDIIFSFMKRGVSPDLAGYIEGDFGNKDFITVEIKSKEITIKDIAQAKLYGDLFSAKYALLISPQPITEEIKRLHQNVFILNRFMSGYNTYIGQLRFSQTTLGYIKVGRPLPLDEWEVEEDWFPESPFQ